MYDDDFSGAADPMELLGVSGMDYVGQAPQYRALAAARRAPPAPILRAAAAATQLGQQVQRSRRLRQLALAGQIPQVVLGVRSAAAIAGGGTATVSPEGSVPLRVTKFVVPAAVAPNFLITRLSAARLDMLAGATAVPAEAFIPNANQPPIENPIIAAGSQIAVGLENIDGAPHNFFALFYGVDLTPAHARMV